MKRTWQIVIIFGILLGSLLVACTPESETAPTSQPATAVPEPTQPAPTATPEPTTIASPTPVPPPTQQPAEAATVTAETPPTAVPKPAFESLGPLPVSQELDLRIVDQWGGAARSMALEGTTAAVGFGPRLLVVDAGDPTSPKLLGQSNILPDLIHDVDLAGDLAYLAAGTAGLIIVDVSDPADIQVLNTGPENAIESPAIAQNITASNGMAFLVDYSRSDGQSTLFHYDVSDPQQVTLLGTHSLPGSASVQALDELLLVTGTTQLQLREAANPAQIMSQTPLAANNHASRAVVQGDIVTVAECCLPSGIERFDISDPYHPAALGPLQETELMPPSHAAADGQILVTANIFGEFGFCQSLVHFTEIDEERSETIASLDPENCLSDIALDEDRLYLAGRSGLQIYDVSDPANPVLLGQFRHPDGFHDAQGLARHQGVTYALNAEGRGFELTTLDLSEQSPDLLLGRQKIGQDVLLDLFAGDDTLIVPVWMGGFYTLDISDPARPQPLRQPAEGELYNGDLFTVAVKDQALYIPVIESTLFGAVGAIDLSDPADPKLVTIDGGGDWQLANLALSGDRLYALRQGIDTHIDLYDLNQPLAPKQVATVTMPEPVSRLAVVGDTLYAACDFHNCQSLYAVDVSDGQNPALISRWTIPFGVRDMIVDEAGTIYLVTTERRIWSMDGRDPAQLRLTGSLGLPGEFARLKVEGDTIYAAAFDGGLYQIQVER